MFVELDPLAGNRMSRKLLTFPFQFFAFFVPRERERERERERKRKIAS